MRPGSKLCQGGANWVGHPPSDDESDLPFERCLQGQGNDGKGGLRIQEGGRISCAGHRGARHCCNPKV